MNVRLMPRHRGQPRPCPIPYRCGFCDRDYELRLLCAVDVGHSHARELHYCQDRAACIEAKHERVLAAYQRRGARAAQVRMAI